MNTFAALLTGCGLGIVAWGSLWLSVQRLVRRGTFGIRGAVLQWARWGVVAGVFYALSRCGAEPLLWGLGGCWLARGLLLAQLGRLEHAR